jgi:hypothetical protein
MAKVRIGLFLLTLAACSPSVRPLPGVSLCSEEIYDMAYASQPCQPCTNVACRGPELPPCSVCGDLSCVAADGGSFCCERPAPPEPLCRPQVKGGP